jgi:hypothetical protein
MAPGSFYAAEGSAEADQLYGRARDGEFRVASSDNGYLIFSPLDINPEMAAAAFALKVGDEVVFNSELNPSYSEAPTQTSTTVEGKINPKTGSKLFILRGIKKILRRQGN